MSGGAPIDQRGRAVPASGRPVSGDPASADPRAGDPGAAAPPEPVPAPVGDRAELAPRPQDAVEEMPRVRITRRRLLASVAFVVGTVAFLYFVLPKLLGLRHTWDRIQHGNGWWLGLAAVLEVASFGGYVALFRAVCADGRRRIDWPVSYEITMAGLAATRLLASGGAGGIALTAWALRRAGMEPKLVATRMIAFLALLYGVFMGCLVVGGVGLYLGVFPGENPFAITIVPAIFGLAVIAFFLGVSLLPGDFDRLVARSARGGRLARLAGQAAAAPAAAASGIREALRLVARRDPSLLGALAWWGFDIAVLWASFHAFGGAPPTAVVVMAYFIGMIGNVLPLPGGIGGVDGAMIGSFTAFGISAPLAVVSVLAYRAFAFWMPTLPGAVAYLQLRRTVQRWRDDPAPSYTL